MLYTEDNAAETATLSHRDDDYVISDEADDETTSFVRPATNGGGSVTGTGSEKMNHPSSPPAYHQEELVLRRQLYTQVALGNAYPAATEPPSSLDVVRKTFCSVSPRCAGKRALEYLPVVNVVRKYRWKQWIVHDIISGLSVGFLHLPQGLGYGILASLKPVYGLYTTFFPLVVYLLFGTSPHISMGTNALIALLTAGLVERMEDEYVNSLSNTTATVTEEEILLYKVGVTMSLTFVCGMMLLAMGILRMGFLTNFMSKSFISGFTFAAAVHITTSQVVKMLHLKLPIHVGMGKLVFTWIDIFTEIHHSNVGDILIGLICMAVLLGVKLGINERFKDRMKIPIPIELIVVVLATIIAHFAHLSDRFGVAVVGSVPSGLPVPALPPVQHMAGVAGEAFVTAILIFTLTISLGKLTAKLHDITIDDNQELVAYGLCSLVGSFFMNFPCSTAPPRTMMLSTLGSRSTLNGVTSAAFILLVLLAAGQLFVSLPIAMLSAMIVVAMKDLLLQVRGVPAMWRVNKSDCCIWLVTALACIFADLDVGMLVGVVVSMVTVLAVSQMAQGKLLGASTTEDVVLELDRAGVTSLPGVRIFRFEASLYFASQERFKNQLFAQVMDPRRVRRKDLYEREVIVELVPAADPGAVPDPANLGQPPGAGDLSPSLKGQGLGGDGGGGVVFEREANANEVYQYVGDCDGQIAARCCASNGGMCLNRQCLQGPPVPLAENENENGQFSHSSAFGNGHQGVQGQGQDRGPGSVPRHFGTPCRPSEPEEEQEQAPVVAVDTVRTLSSSSGEPRLKARSSAVTANGLESDRVPEGTKKKKKKHGKGRGVTATTSSEHVRHLILDCSAMQYVDLSGVDMLTAVVTQFRRAGVETWLVAVPAGTLGTLRRSGLVGEAGKVVGEDRVYYSLFDALRAVRRESETENHLVAKF